MDLRVFVSGAPGTGKSAVAVALGRELGLPVLSLDVVKEALGDSLGLGDEAWSDRLGDAAAHVLFTLAATFPGVVVEGWWRRDRRERAIQEFAGWVEVFCRCDPDVAAQRARARLEEARHPIHRDVINPALVDELVTVVGATEPLHVSGGRLVRLDTGGVLDGPAVAAAVLAAAT